MTNFLQCVNRTLFNTLPWQVREVDKWINEGKKDGWQYRQQLQPCCRVKGDYPDNNVMINKTDCGTGHMGLLWREIGTPYHIGLDRFWAIGLLPNETTLLKTCFSTYTFQDEWSKPIAIFETTVGFYSHRSFV